MRDLKERLVGELRELPISPDAYERTMVRVQRRNRNSRVIAGIAALLVAGGAVLLLARAWAPNSQVPAERPTRPVPGPFGQVGGWIAYSRGNDGIWAVDPARPGRRIRLSRADADPIAWSSNGSKLLIQLRSSDPSGGSSQEGLYVLDADGTETRLTNAGVEGGTFSPDGSEVVYAAGPSERSAIYAVSSDGGAPRLILRSRRRISFPDGRSAPAFAYDPAVSPDGRRIAYFDGFGDHSHNLWVANADGTERRVLLDDEVSRPGHIEGLTWAPDGEWLAFRTYDGIYVVRPDGSELTRVGVDALGPSGLGVQWSPDGTRIAYQRAGTVLVIVKVEGDDGSILNAWSRDERIIEGIGPDPVQEPDVFPYEPEETPGSIAWNPAG